MVNWISQTKPLDLLRRGLSRRPWYVVLYVTSHCNQRCNMCFNWKNLNTLKRSEEWSLDEIRLLAEQLPDLYQLTLTGGEPTLRQDLGEIIEIFFNVAGVSRITVATNGSYPDRVDKLIRQVTSSCPGLTLSINLSIDGIGQTHDQIRGMPGSFDRLVETWHIAKQHSRKSHQVNVATASVLTAGNLAQMKDLLNWVAANMDIGSHGVMLARGDVATQTGAAASEDDFIDILQYHSALARSAGRLNQALADEYFRCRVKTIKSRKMANPCRSGDKLIIIDEKANVHPCEILNVLAAAGKTGGSDLGDFCFGNLRASDFNLGSLLESPRAKEIRRFIQEERCWCTFECAQINNLVLDPLSYLRLFGRVIGVGERVC
ncbi:MAG: radical SAM protein [Alphaproteobacteria bacterium]|nr:radical SAM protein [Alphaproteobacteria bacterium]